MPVDGFSWRADERPVGEFVLLEMALQFCKEQWPDYHPVVRDGLFQDPKHKGIYMFGAFFGRFEV